jgi:hypothetical protein
MKKNELDEHIHQIFDAKVKPALDVCKIKFVIKPSGTKIKLKHCIFWMERLDTHTLMSYYNQTSPETWRSFEIFGLHDLPEMEALKALKRQFILKWMKRPSCIRLNHVEAVNEGI